MPFFRPVWKIGGELIRLREGGCYPVHWTRDKCSLRQLDSDFNFRQSGGGGDEEDDRVCQERLVDGFRTHRFVYLKILYRSGASLRQVSDSSKLNTTWHSFASTLFEICFRPSVQWMPFRRPIYRSLTITRKCRLTPAETLLASLHVSLLYLINVFPKSCNTFRGT